MNDSKNTMFKLLANKAERAKLSAQIAIIVIVFINSNFKFVPVSVFDTQLHAFATGIYKVSTLTHRLIV